MSKNGQGRDIPNLDYVVEKYYEKLYSLIICSPFDEELDRYCWEWTGEISKREYGVFRVYKDGRRYRFQAHRIFWAMSRGRWPSQHSDIHHKCKNRECVNPAHLTAARIKDNRGKNDEAMQEDVDDETGSLF